MMRGGAKKSSKSKNQKMAAAELPQEIIGNILIRLPVKSLVRFRCVCKLWRSLINDSYFIRKHVNRITNLYNTKMEDEYESPIVSIHSTTSLDGATINTTIFKFLDTDKKEGKFEDNSIHNEPIMLSFRDIDFPEQLKPCYAFIRGSCDGILCVVTSDCVLLWNPSIREYKILHPSCPNKYFGVDVDVYGMGYDASVDDYKVLRAPSIFSTRSSVEVLALKSNSWKIIQNNFPYKLICLYHSIFANGGIHWVAKRALTQKEVILCFNVVSEKFNEVPLPPSTDLNFRYSTLLRLFRGNLCVFQYHPLLKFNGGSYLDVWVMKEYGVGESWSKLFTVPQLRGHDNWCEPLEPFCLTRSGIILVCSTRFVLYNWHDGTFKKLSIDPTGLFNGNFMYVESLVSPIGGYKI